MWSAPARPIRPLRDSCTFPPADALRKEATGPCGPTDDRRGPRPGRTSSGPDGRFVIQGVTEESEVEITAERGMLRTPEPVVAAPDVAGPVRLVLDASRAGAMSGRVLDGAGRPIAGAQVHLRSFRRNDRGGIDTDQLVEFDRGPILTADAAGRLTTPVELDRGLEYAAYAEAPGRQAGRTPWVAAAARTFPDLTLDREFEGESPPKP